MMPREMKQICSKTVYILEMKIERKLENEMTIIGSSMIAETLSAEIGVGMLNSLEEIPMINSLMGWELENSIPSGNTLTQT